MAFSLPADYDRVWDGPIFYKKGTFVSRYEPFWGVVRRESSRGLQRIDLFRPQSAVNSTSDLFVPLHDVLQVLNREARARRFAFQILATGCKYHLAAESAEERERWVQGLKQLLCEPPQPGVVYEYQVMVIPNSHSEKLYLSGRYILRITDSHAALFTSTGTLPTRFLYCLSDITRTQYTNFTDAGQKFSVLVLYCSGGIISEHMPVNRSNSFGVIHSVTDGDAAKEEGMFVFQTQSASTISKTIEHRAREMARKEKQAKPNSCLNLVMSKFSPVSVPTSIYGFTHEEDNVVTPTLRSSEKPHPPTRLARPSEDYSNLDRVSRRERSGATTVPLKPKKVPIPLPQSKKYSLDSSTQLRDSTTGKGAPPRAKSRPHPPPRPKLHGLSSVEDLITHPFLAATHSVTSTTSLPILDSLDLTSNSTSAPATVRDSSKAEPTYVNLPSSASDEQGLEGVKRIKDGDRNRSRREHVQKCNMNGGDGSDVKYYNIHPSKSYDSSLAEESPVSSAPHEQHLIIQPSNSCDMLSSPTEGVTSAKDLLMTDGQGSESKDDQLPFSATKGKESPGEDSLSSLDEFLAQILQRRRESRDINEVCDNEKREEGKRRMKPSLGRVRGNDPQVMMQVGACLGQSGSPQTPHYYNLPPLLRSKGLTVDEDDEEDENLVCAGVPVEKRRSYLSWGDSLPEREYRSEWLRRGSSVQDWMPMTRTGVGPSEDDDSFSTYLKILPSTAQSLPHPPQQALAVVSSKERPSSPIVEEQYSNSASESGSPLWGTHRASSRQSSVPSPLAKGDRLNSPPPSPSGSILQEVPCSPPVTRKKKRLGSHRKTLKQGTLSRQRRLSRKDSMVAKWLSYTGTNAQKAEGGTFRLGPLPSLPKESMDVDSDYEWAEVGEVLSDTGSDYTYTKPFDFALFGVDFDPRRSASCSDLGVFSLAFPTETFGERPPAPLPMPYQDPLVGQNPAHSETPISTPEKRLENKRRTLQRSRSVDDSLCTSEIYEELESQVDYESIKDFEGDYDYDYDYAHVPNRSVGSLFSREQGEYIDINRNSPSHNSPTPSSPSSSSYHFPTTPAIPPRQKPRPPPRSQTSVPITDV